MINVPNIELDQVDFPPLDTTKPSAIQIRDAVKSAILTTDLPPGCRLSESEIGTKFGASRTPVREAFALLREEGLIVTRPSRGNFVSALSKKSIRQAQFLREAIELATIRRLCETGLSEQIRAELNHCLDEQAKASAAGDNARFQVEDNRFHLLLATATGFDRTGILLTREKAALDRLRVLALEPKKHKMNLLTEHLQIFAAVESRDPGRAVPAMQKHLRSILDVLDRLAPEHSGLFEP